MLRPFERMQITSPAMFVEKVLQPRRLGMEDLARFVRHELGIQELISTVALSGRLITPQEGLGFYLRENEQVLTEAAFFSASNQLAGISAPPEALSQFYSNRIANYRIPERVQVSYVKFDLTNYFSEADEQLTKMTDLNQRIDQVYESRGTNYYPEAKTPAEAKTRIKEEMRKELARLSARKYANDFATRVIEREPLRAENLAEAAKEKNLPVQVSAPFALREPPEDLKVSEDFTTRAFELSPTNEPLAGPIVGEEAVYVIAFHKRIPSENPPFEQVQERVAADYKFSQALSQARAAGMEFSQTVSNGLTQGKTFTAICAEAKVTPTTLPPFSISTRELPDIEKKISLNQLKSIAFRTPPGTSSGFQPTIEGGLVLYVKSKQPPDETKIKAELPQFLSSTRQTRQNEVFNEWFRKEFDRTMRDTPLYQQQQQQKQQQQQQPPGGGSGASPS
jgi:peptidyl-prolyl cis-trans isomerase D